MTSLTAAELATSVRFSRPVRNGSLTLFAVMRNEMYFLPAFLAHYRALGVEQFVIVDDASDDGTTQYLAAQPDCCSGISHIRYGDRVTVTDAAPGGLSGRAGPILKRVLPEHFLRGQYVLCADADEFLILPGRYPRLGDVTALMAEHGWKTVSASLIDFYPASLADLADEQAPATPQELFRRFGHFDAVPFMAVRPGHQPEKTGRTASERLFLMCGIRQIPPAIGFLPAALASRLPFPAPNAAWFKTPIVLHDGETFMDGAHEANVPPPPGFILAMAHFKFNGDTYRKIQSALRLKSHARKGQKYQHYEDMLRIMEQRGLGFLGPPSRAYTGPAQLLAAGLMRLPE